MARERTNKPKKTDLNRINVFLSDLNVAFIERTIYEKGAGIETYLSAFRRLYNDAVPALKQKFTPGELKMFINVFNGHIMTNPGILLYEAVRDTFEYGMFEDDFGIDQDDMLLKIKELSDFEQTCVEIWACGFWVQHDAEKPEFLNEYIS